MSQPGTSAEDENGQAGPTTCTLLNLLDHTTHFFNTIILICI